jgi:hypothetical protein
MESSRARPGEYKDIREGGVQQQFHGKEPKQPSKEERIAAFFSLRRDAHNKWLDDHVKCI